jgi:hypothetical protein
MSQENNSSDWKLRSPQATKAVVNSIEEEVWKNPFASTQGTIGSPNCKYSSITEILYNQANVVQWAILIRTTTSSGTHKGSYKSIINETPVITRRPSCSDEKRDECLATSEKLFNTTHSDTSVIYNYEKTMTILRKKRSTSLAISNAELTCDSLLYLIAKRNEQVSGPLGTNRLNDQELLKKLGLLESGTQSNPSDRFLDFKNCLRLTQVKEQFHLDEVHQITPAHVLRRLTSPPNEERMCSQTIVNGSVVPSIPLETELRSYSIEPFHLFVVASSWRSPRQERDPAILAFCTVYGGHSNDLSNEVKIAYSDLLHGIIDCTQDTLTDYVEENARDIGLEDARRTFAHQIKAIGFGVGNSWIVDPRQWEAIKAEAKREQWATLNYHIVPIAEVFTAIKSTLYTWSLSHRPEDIFGSETPGDLGELLLCAYKIAGFNRLAAFATNKKFQTEVEDIRKVQEFLENENAKVKICEKSLTSLRMWKIEESAYKACVRNQVVISSLLRVFVVICENFLQHGHEILKVNADKIENQSNEMRLLMEFENPAPEKVAVTQNQPLQLGFHGEQILRNIIEKELCGSYSTPHRKPTYVTKLDLPLPAWLVHI